MLFIYLLQKLHPHLWMVHLNWFLFFAKPACPSLTVKGKECSLGDQNKVTVAQNSSEVDFSAREFISKCFALPECMSCASAVLQRSLL